MTDLNQFDTQEMYEELMANPKQYGLPSFQEFAANPDKWRQKDDVLASADNGITQFRQFLKKQRYFYEGYECRSLEDVERCAQSDGINTLQDLDMAPQIVDIGGGKMDLYVKFTRKKKELANE